MKSSMHRIRRTPEGRAMLDPRGNGAGRGAYVCSIECFEKASAGGRLSAALRTKVDQRDAETLLNDLRIAIDRAQRS